MRAHMGTRLSENQWPNRKEDRLTSSPSSGKGKRRRQVAKRAKSKKGSVCESRQKVLDDGMSTKAIRMNGIAAETAASTAKGCPESEVVLGGVTASALILCLFAARFVSSK